MNKITVPTQAPPEPKVNKEMQSGKNIKKNRETLRGKC
jgi:hypothetical protein